MIRLALRVRRAEAEIALAELLELAPSGVEERELPGDVVEYAVYGPPGELPALPELRAAVGGALVDIVSEEIPDDWHERWRAFHRPVELPCERAGGLGLRVRPPWEPARPGGGGVLDLVIDPGQAFGTGAHETTRLCLELLLTLEPGGACVDLGCGSGVLAIAAARLGWGPVLGLDHEEASIEATLANAAANGARVSARRFDLLLDGPPPVAPTVLANLVRPLLLTIARGGLVDGAVPRRLIASGLLVGEADEVAAAFARQVGLREVGRRCRGEWAALLLES
ncbi:MAG: 50S ribosomal protein L11 methyltransferase [Solirubrobacteraceae bacterium]|nr:50S ribosomal protein L11 methyltransferase [Solirubrobacteraceae bacterium]